MLNACDRVLSCSMKLLAIHTTPSQRARLNLLSYGMYYAIRQMPNSIRNLFSVVQCQALSDVIQRHAGASLSHMVYSTAIFKNIYYVGCYSMTRDC
jgi:hypothetical protein